MRKTPVCAKCGLADILRNIKQDWDGFKQCWREWTEEYIYDCAECGEVDIQWIDNNITHTCGGTIEAFSKNYGLCNYCGDEGEFELIDGAHAKFTKVTVNRK